MKKSKKISVLCTSICCLILSISAINNYSIESSGKAEVFQVMTNDIVGSDETEFISNTEDTEAEPVVIEEKIAVHPEYIFETVEETYYLLDSISLKDIPYDEGKDIQILDQYSEIKIIGKNNLKYWKVSENSYIDSSKITNDKRYIFTPTEETKYSSGEVSVKAEPFNESDTIMTLNLNDQVTLIGENSNQYWKVKINNTIGYVDKDLLMSNKKSALIKNDGIYTVRSQEELELIYAIVMQEAGNNYQGALAVISSAANRCNSSKWSSYGSTIYEQLTANGQYCYSIDNYWRKYLGGNVPDAVKQAVADGLNGVTNHSFTCFRSTSGGDSSRVNIGGNWYFGD